MAFGDHMDYSHLATWWLLGPASLVLCFVVFAIAWKIYQYIIRNQQKQKLQELKLSANNFSIEEPEKMATKSQAFSTPKTLRIDIKFSNLGLQLRTTGKRVLQGVTGEIHSGRMTAVMGPSGSGKTTFMTTIAGKAYYGKMTGKILINNRNDLPITKFKNTTGFVPQEDIMLREMTVEETLQFSAFTRLPKSMSRAEKLVVVEDVLHILDLNSIRFSPIGDENIRGISGGQRKRVNIGIELVSDPTLLFLDEPTSGLDSSSSMSICQALRNISSLGLTIVAVIHQPRYEIFEMFHDVLLLAKGGRTVYLGPSKDALQYFESLNYECPVHANPADFLIDIISEVQPNKHGEIISDDILVDLWKKYERSKKEEEEAAQLLEEEVPLDDELEYDTGVNPVDFYEIIQYLKKFYYFTKGTLEKQIPSLALSKEELYPLNASSGEHVTDHMEVKIGSLGTMLAYFIIIALTFITAPIAFFKLPFEKTEPSLRRQYGGIFALCFDVGLMIFIFFMRWIAIIGGNDVMISIGYAGVLLFCIIPGIMLFLGVVFLIKQYREKKFLQYAAPMVGGMFGWLFYILISWKSPNTSIPKRMASLVGYLIGGWFILSLTASILMQGAEPGTSTGFLPFSPETFGISIFYIFTAFLLARRMHLLPLQIRPKPSFKLQLWETTKRCFVQVSRNWFIYIFDIILVINAGVFVGIIYYQQYYEGPIIEQFPNEECPDAFPDEVCKVMTIPQKDPFSGQASITCLSLALAAVASSLRIFGEETVTFRRESAAGLSTEAYYIGKSLAHLPTEILAPLAFTLCYYALVLPITPFYQYFFLYFLIYWSCAGLAFLVSLVSPHSLAQLAGVLTILTFMMFSGAAPTLEQLKANELLPYVLWSVSWVSLFRYTQELYYLISIIPYNPSPDTATLVYYGYNLNDLILCWMMIFALGIVFRFLAYIALVVRERRN